MNKTLHAYYAELTANLHSLYTAEAFAGNQVLPLLREPGTLSFTHKITYYIEEIDKLESVPAFLLRFLGSEMIDEEHYFFFFAADGGKACDTLERVQRVLRATVAKVVLQGEVRLLVQHVEAIPESGYLKAHQPVATPVNAMAS